MSRGSRSLTRIHDPLSFLWLAAAAVLFIFTGFQWTIPLAAWFGPLFLVRFVRTQRVIPGLLLAWLARWVVAAFILLRGIILIHGPAYYVVVLLLTALSILPYLADRLIAHRLRGFAATLVFPAAVTVIEYLSSFGPNGTINSIANTQFGDLPLIQLASVTGIWGITFLLSWFAAAANWAWEQGFAWLQIRRGVLVYGVILSVVLLGGGARLALFSPAAAAVRVAGVSPSAAAVSAARQQLPGPLLDLLLTGKAAPADRQAARSAFMAVDDDLLASSQKEARAGARIVVWPEPAATGASVLEEDQPALLKQAGDLARQEGIYLDLGLSVLLPGGGKGPFAWDEAVLIDPAGKVVWTYEKFHLVPFGEKGVVVQGDGKVPVVDSPLGRLANVICFDLDFPATLRQAGRAGVDMMLGPSDDWRAIDPAHTRAATFRAVENGFSLVRQANNGLAMAVDYQGRVLAASDFYTTDQQVLVAYVPMHGVRTIYARIGDVFALLCVLALLAFIVLAVVRPADNRPER